MRPVRELLKDEIVALGRPMTREEISEFIKTHKNTKTAKEIAESQRAEWSKENLPRTIFRLCRHLWADIRYRLRHGELF